jgi:hypothetical protein
VKIVTVVVALVAIGSLSGSVRAAEGSIAYLEQDPVAKPPQSKCKPTMQKSSQRLTHLGSDRSVRKEPCIREPDVMRVIVVEASPISEDVVAYPAFETLSQLPTCVSCFK